MWSAALLYYCAVKGKDMGFGELHKHLIKYVRCPAKRYWYVLTAVVAMVQARWSPLCRSSSR